MEDLKQLTYVDVMKMFLCYISNQKENRKKEEGIRDATQADIDRFF